MNYILVYLGITAGITAIAAVPVLIKKINSLLRKKEEGNRDD